MKKRKVNSSVQTHPDSKKEFLGVFLLQKLKKCAIIIVRGFAKNVFMWYDINTMQN